MFTQFTVTRLVSRFAPCLLLFALSSCCTRTALTVRERAWLTPYARGERAVFRSNRGTVDTLLVTRKSEFYTNEGCNWFEIGPYKQHSMSVGLRLLNCRPHMTCDSYVQISKQKPQELSLPEMAFFGLEYLSWRNSSTIERAVTLSTTHKTYPAAYSFVAGVNATTIGGASTGYLYSFDWDLNDGLIRYETQAGEIFEWVGK